MLSLKNKIISPHKSLGKPSILTRYLKRPRLPPKILLDILLYDV